MVPSINVWLHNWLCKNVHLDQGSSTFFTARSPNLMARWSRDPYSTFGPPYLDVSITLWRSRTPCWRHLNCCYPLLVHRGSHWVSVDWTTGPSARPHLSPSKKDCGIEYSSLLWVLFCPTVLVQIIKDKLLLGCYYTNGLFPAGQRHSNLRSVWNQPKMLNTIVKTRLVE